VEFLTELIGVGVLALIGWFGSTVLGKMDSIHDDLKDIAVQHGERLAKLEVVSHAKCQGTPN
jgi:hypothetical protein